MKFIPGLLLFFSMKIYLASGYINIEFANPSPHSKKIGPNEKQPHSHIKPRQTDVTDFKISISKNPSQAVKLRFDTGSPGMWVFSDRYDSCDSNWNAVRTKHNRYNYSISTTYRTRGELKPQLMTYLDEFAFGYRASDTLSISGVEVQKSFLEVTKASKYLTDLDYDGVIGLQYDPKNKDTYGNVIAEICKGKSKVFSFSYPKNPSEAGTITLCGSNPKFYNSGTQEIIKESEPGTWLIPVAHIMLGDEAVVPFGTNLLIRTELFAILVPREKISDVNNKIKLLFPELTTESEFDCQIVPRLPYLNFVFAYKNHGLSAEHYTREVYTESMGKRCKFLFEPSPHDYWTVGVNFIRKFYTTFDMENNQIVIYRSSRV